MSKQRKIVLACLLVLIIITSSWGGMFFAFTNRPMFPEKPVALLIQPGMPFSTVADKLYQDGVISDPFMFRLLSRLRGSDNAIQAGEYDFRSPATPGQILDRLVAGDVRRYKLTIPEGFNLAEIGARLEEAEIGSKDDFMTLTSDPVFLQQLKIEADSLEGYLFPETYTYVAGTSLRNLVTSMVDQFRKKLTPELLAGGAEQGLDAHQLVTLASIVQKEAGNNEEMPLIAAVFLNRIERRIPLQADPTVIYGLGDEYDGNITKADLRMPTPYNTYTMVGLPPGPIASPGTEALQAVASPADVKYLYFVARGDGTHSFSKTLKEHNKAVRKYQLKK